MEETVNMIDKPLVSIGMPVYNGERYIRKALDSLLAQDYENFELIISDNASTDKTLRICGEYAARDKRISIQVNSCNVGSPKNFRAVLNYAQGEYFMWAAVDDYWLSDFVSSLVEELNRHPEAGVAMCAVDRTWKDGTLFDTVRFSGRKNPNRKSFLGMALGLATSLKYNLFIYGLFRTRLIKSALPIPIVESGDRWFLSQFALTTKFRYIDSVLHIRMVHYEPYQDRYPDDEFGRKKMVSEKRWFYFQPVLVVYRILSHSKIVPWHRKIFIPIILGYLFCNRIVVGARRMARSFIVRFFPYNLQKRLIRIVRYRNNS
jgi:glycosyltransferase involved in cell wall biosynthesis